MKIPGLIILCLFFSCFVYSNELPHVVYFNHENCLVQIIQDNADTISIMPGDSLKAEVKGKRIKAIILTVLTGPLGGHRIYLGTKAAVPVLYSLTLGGGILVTIIDLGYLIFSKDISLYENNSRFFMWIKKNH